MRMNLAIPEDASDRQDRGTLLCALSEQRKSLALLVISQSLPAINNVSIKTLLCTTIRDRMCVLPDEACCFLHGLGGRICVVDSFRHGY